MSKPIILDVDCAANAVLAKQWLEQDGSGAMKAFDGTGDAKGVAVSDKNVSNHVGMVKQALIKLIAIAATYNVGDSLEIDATGQALQALSLGTKVGEAAETLVLSADGELLVYMNV